MEPRHQRNLVAHKSANTWGAVQFGGRPPLFDRLCGDHGTNGSPRSYSIREVLDSVVRELRNLLNTRVPVGTGSADNSGIETVATYGFPDFSSLSAASNADRLTIARLMERKVEAFEPRLRNVFVSFAPDPAEPSSVIGTLEATLQIEAIRRPVSFRLSDLMESQPEPTDNVKR